MINTKIDLISIDVGKTGGIAFWKNNLCVGVMSWEIKKNELLVEHISHVVNMLSEIISQYKPEIAVERPSKYLAYQWILYSDLKTLAGKNKCNFYAYMPQTIKKQVTGYGRTDKEAMKDAVLSSGFLANDVSPKNEHEYDCVGCGICHVRKINAS